MRRGTSTQLIAVEEAMKLVVRAMFGERAALAGIAIGAMVVGAACSQFAAGGAYAGAMQRWSAWQSTSALARADENSFGIDDCPLDMARVAFALKARALDVRTASFPLPPWSERGIPCPINENRL
jgi:hypothetical protein